MSGVRIHHPELKNAVLTVPHPRPLKAPFKCPICSETHITKTYHITLDNNGDAIVSHEIVARLKEVNLAGMTVENEVENPPAQLITNAVAIQPDRIVVPYEGREGKWQEKS